MRMHQAIGQLMLGMTLLTPVFSYAEGTARDTGTVNKKVSTEIESSANVIHHLKQLIKEKDKAIDLSISEIKRLGVRHLAFIENPSLVKAYDQSGWEDVALDGLPSASIKPFGDDIIVRVPMADKGNALKMMAARSTAIFVCNGMECFVLPSSILASN